MQFKTITVQFARYPWNGDIHPPEESVTLHFLAPPQPAGSFKACVIDTAATLQRSTRDATRKLKSSIPYGKIINLYFHICGNPPTV